MSRDLDHETPRVYARYKSDISARCAPGILGRWFTRCMPRGPRWSQTQDARIGRYLPWFRRRGDEGVADGHEYLLLIGLFDLFSGRQPSVDQLPVVVDLMQHSHLT